MDQHTPITATFIWTFEDAKARQKALAAEPIPSTGKSALAAWLTYGILAAAVVLLLFPDPDARISQFLSAFRDNLTLFAILTPPILIIWAMLTFLPMRNLKRSFLQSPDSNRRVEVMFTPDIILMKVPDVYEMKWEWAAIHEVRRTPKGLCFFQAPKTGFWIPLHAFQSAADVQAVSEMARRLTPRFVVTIA
jgi:hypothetical protein